MLINADGDLLGNFEIRIDLEFWIVLSQSGLLKYRRYTLIYFCEATTFIKYCEAILGIINGKCPIQDR